MRFLFANIEKWVWYLFVATFAWQTRLILWQADRVFVEWRSISLYASDVLMLALFAFALWHRPKLKFDTIDKVLAIFLAAAFISIGHADQIMVSLYQWARLVQFAGLFWYVRYYAIPKFDTDATLTAFVVGALIQSGLARAQYTLQHDVGIRWMGETLLNTHMNGVAVFYDLAHTKILRAYGTLPHPNVLAVYLMTALWALAYLYLRHGHFTRKTTVIWTACGTLMLWALYLTYSRTMIAIWLVATAAFIVFVWKKSGAQWPNIAIVRRRLRDISVFTVVISAVFGALFWQQVVARATISTSEEAVTLRVYYAKEALGSGNHSLLDLNWTGVGIGNFVSWLERTDPAHPSWMYQPAHNLYLLIYSETGILGIGLFIAYLVLILRAAIQATHRPGVVRWGLVMLLCSFFAVALFDHFFWTLQQGRILFWVVLAVAA